MAIDPQVQMLLDQMAANPQPPLEELGPEKAREMLAAMAQLGGPGPDMASVSDHVAPGPGGDIPVRVYRPSHSPDLPVLVWFHGGGWVLGSVEQSDATARHLASAGQLVVVSVEYRLAPEHRFPSGVDDCEAATRWIAAHAAELGADAGRMAVGGDSAGGNLAAVIAQRLRDTGGPALRAQLLVYPAVDARMSYPSIRANGEGYLLTEASMRWFYDLYLAGADPDDPSASPMSAPDLSGLPPALIITAEYDPLRDEGEAYGLRLDQAGVPATATRFDGQIHGFFGMVGLLDGAGRAVKEAGAWLQKTLSSDQV